MHVFRRSLLTAAILAAAAVTASAAAAPTLYRPPITRLPVPEPQFAPEPMLRHGPLVFGKGDKLILPAGFERSAVVVKTSRP